MKAIEIAAACSILAVFASLEARVLRERPSVRISDASRGRVPAAARATYELKSDNVSVCGKTYSALEMRLGDGLHVVYETIRLRAGGTSALAMLPSRVISRAVGGGRFSNAGLRTLALSNPPLLIPRPTTSDPDMIRRYCVSLEAAEIVARRMGYVSTPLVSVARTRDGAWVVNVASEASDAITRDALGVRAEIIDPEHIQHIVFYSPEYENEAKELAAYHMSRGLNSYAFNVNTLPGMQSSVDVPAECEGSYRDECHYVPGVSPQLTDFPDEFVPALYGMVNNVNAGERYERAIDRAGILRATIRRYKKRNPSLKYVVFMGKPDDFPIRFTNVDEVGTVIPARAFSLPSDVYYADAFSPWTQTNRVNSTTHSPLIWPNGQTSAPDNTDWDTTHFIWPVRAPFARVFQPPNGMQISELTRSRFVSVGRIMAKARRAGTKDPGMAGYVEKLKEWEAGPKDYPSFASFEDGVYQVNNLRDVEDVSSAFHAIGEGFGTGWNANAASDPACMANRPPANDWHQAGSISMLGYQSQPNSCKPKDPAISSYNGVSHWPLPSPKELTLTARRLGFSFISFAGHGGPIGLGMNSNGYAGYPGRGFLTSEFAATNVVDSTLSDLAPWKAAKQGGLALSSACSTGGFSGGHASSIEWARTHKTFAEDFITCVKCGGVVGWFNGQEGWYYGDPGYDGMLLQNYADLATKNGEVRAGDVAIGLLRDSVPPTYSSGGMSWQTLNRGLFGDPAARAPVLPANPQPGRSR